MSDGVRGRLERLESIDGRQRAFLSAMLAGMDSNSRNEFLDLWRRRQTLSDLEDLRLRSLVFWKLGGPDAVNEFCGSRPPRALTEDDMERIARRWAHP